LPSHRSKLWYRPSRTPGPRARRIRGFLPEFRKDPLTLVTRVAQEYGDIVRLQLGPWYVLADELIPSGESLLRNLLAGRAEEALVEMEAAFQSEWYGDAVTRAHVAAELARLLAGLGRRDQAEWYARWAREH